MKKTVAASVLLLLVASLAAAQSGRMPGMRGDSPMMITSDGMSLPVASDGTVFLARRSTTRAGFYDLVAVRPSGTQAWSYPLENRGMTEVAITSTTVFVGSFGTSGTFPNFTVKSQLVGLNITTGAKIWSLDLDGMPSGLTAYNDGVYLITLGTTTTGGMMGSISRKLLSVGNDGKVKFTVPID